MEKLSVILVACLWTTLAEPPVDRSYLPPSHNVESLTSGGRAGPSRPATEYGVPGRRPGTPLSQLDAAAAPTFGAPEPGRLASGPGSANGFQSPQYAAPQSSPPGPFGKAAPLKPAQQYGAPTRTNGAPGRFSSSPAAPDSAQLNRPSPQYGAPAAGPSSSLPGRFTKPSFQYGAPPSASGRLETPQIQPAQFNRPSQYGAPSTTGPFQKSASGTGPQNGVPGVSPGRLSRPQVQPAQFTGPSSQYGAPATGPSSSFSEASGRFPAVSGPQNGVTGVSPSTFTRPQVQPAQLTRPAPQYGVPATGPSSSFPGAPGRFAAEKGVPGVSSGRNEGPQSQTPQGTPDTGSPNAFPAQPTAQYGAPSPASDRLANSQIQNAPAPFQQNAPLQDQSRPGNAANVQVGYPGQGVGAVGLQDGAPGQQQLANLENLGVNGEEEGLSEPANYEFSYEVNDGAGTEFGHRESRTGDLAQGEYHVLLPDGRRQVVEYEADVEGYRPQIRYEESEGGRRENLVDGTSYPNAPGANAQLQGSFPQQGIPTGEGAGISGNVGQYSPSNAPLQGGNNGNGQVGYPAGNSQAQERYTNGNGQLQGNQPNGQRPQSAQLNGYTNGRPQGYPSSQLQNGYQNPSVSSQINEGSSKGNGKRFPSNANAQEGYTAANGGYTSGSQVQGGYPSRNEQGGYPRGNAQQNDYQRPSENLRGSYSNGNGQVNNQAGYRAPGSNERLSATNGNNAAAETFPGLGGQTQEQGYPSGRPSAPLTADLQGPY